MAESPCLIPDCGRRVLARGWCKVHYDRWWRHGDVDVTPQTPLATRLWAKIDRRGGLMACWPWPGAHSREGYGRVSLGRPSTTTCAPHRVAYELLVGPIPTGLQLDHLCRRPACCNPSHLRPVTSRENTRRGAGHGSELVCPQGHAYTEANTSRERKTGKRHCKRCDADRHQAKRDILRRVTA